MVVNELRGEKIDIVPFSEDFQDFVAKALSPAKVSQVIVSDDGTQADVIVPDHQLSLAIGREGQNARLAARLTGVRIDIRSETQLAEGIPARGGEAEETVEYAEGQWVTNAAGENEWHAADGTVISEAQWTAQQESASAAGPDAQVETEPAPEAAPERGTVEEEPAPVKASDADAGATADETESPVASEVEAGTGEARASDEPDATEPSGEGAIENGASDEPDVTEPRGDGAIE
jgi:N utilization substance protein A